MTATNHESSMKRDELSVVENLPKMLAPSGARDFSK
jgi:hypothetical protein